MVNKKQICNLSRNEIEIASRKLRLKVKSLKKQIGNLSRNKFEIF